MLNKNVNSNRPGDSLEKLWNLRPKVYEQNEQNERPAEKKNLIPGNFCRIPKNFIKYSTTNFYKSASVTLVRPYLDTYSPGKN